MTEESGRIPNEWQIEGALTKNALPTSLLAPVYDDYAVPILSVSLQFRLNRPKARASLRLTFRAPIDEPSPDWLQYGHTWHFENSARMLC